MSDDDKSDDKSLDDLERRLREGLHQEAQRINPRDRRTEIMAMVDDQTQVGEPGRRWLIPVAAAAAVALIGVVSWGVASGGSRQATPTGPATSATSATAPPPDTGVPGAGPSAAGSNPRPAGATTPVALPAYFVGASSAAGKKFGLYREFVRTDVPVGATAVQKARAAVAVAMKAQPFTTARMRPQDGPYLRPWSGTSVQDLTATPDRITITLSGPGASGLTAQQTRLAVQELVWTAQAALGQGPVPVTFVVADGSTKLFGSYPTTATYNRPASDVQYLDLAPIWIISPARDQVLKAGAPVVATGQSCAFEATTQWQLRKGAAMVRSGSTMASSGCPTRGTWKVNLGVLPAGSYTFRMFEVSMQDGTSVIGEASTAFTVR